jgi:hypothetical protein
MLTIAVMNAANPMKRPTTILRQYPFGLAILWVGLTCGLWCPNGQGQATLPFHEPFPDSYPENTLLGAGATSTLWSAGSGTGTGSAYVSSSAALSYAGLDIGGGRGLVQPQGGTARNRGVPFTPQTLGAANPTVYASFLLQPKVTPTSTRLIAYLQSSTSAGTPSAGVFINTSLQLQVSRNSTTPAAATTPALSLNTTYFVVFAYKWNSGTGNDQVALWLNPTPGSSEPAPTISATTGGSDVSTLAAFFLAVPSSSTGSTNWVDEIRVGLTWADVTPAVIPEPMTVALGVVGGIAVAFGLKRARARYRHEAS